MLVNKKEYYFDDFFGFSRCKGKSLYILGLYCLFHCVFFLFFFFASSNNVCTFATVTSLARKRQKEKELKKRKDVRPVTLSYDKNDEVANAKLAALLSTGLFVQLESQDDMDIDYSDQSLYETDPSLPVIDRDMSPEELEQLIVEDIHSLYQTA